MSINASGRFDCFHGNLQLKNARIIYNINCNQCAEFFLYQISLMAIRYKKCFMQYKLSRIKTNEHSFTLIAHCKLSVEMTLNERKSKNKP